MVAPEQSRWALVLTALFFLTGGVLHFVLIDYFIAIMPAYLPWHRELVQVSGVFELMGALGILIPATRQWAAWGLIALCIAVFPANLNMALHPDHFSNIPVVLLVARLPLQLLIIWIVAKAGGLPNRSV
ncbi:DoxX family protein [Limnobacter sp.]|uniref:DoxX family protein n=1 Tax=Limnobacter sp. TaxID=2003368 RepID=UPI00258B37B8|nr:DoxX family protein [Limnobacter sp.]HEX5486654.1 DoxX family protein [Limnobacter sp.]